MLAQVDVTVMSRLYVYFFGHHASTGIRLLLVVVLAICSQLVVKIVRHISEWLTTRIHGREVPFGFERGQPKFITLIQLIANAATFCIYFLALGMILQEFGVNLTAYLASASILGLAISFGSQGLVQDMVIGLTLIFSDVMDVGDMVQIVGATNVIGRVNEIGLRFTKLVDFYNQVIFIPNHTIANVNRYPHGGIDAYADIQIPSGADQQKILLAIQGVTAGMWMQFGEIILNQPTVGSVETADGGAWNYVRVHFKIWPGQGSLIESTFCQHVVIVMKEFDPNYALWQIPVTYRASTAPKKI